MWNVIGAIVVLVIGYYLGQMNVLRKFASWVNALPEDLRDVVRHATKEYPLNH